MLAGMILGLIAFPTETGVGDVPVDTIFKLGLAYGPLILLIWLGACFVIHRYNISRAHHSENLARLGGT